MSASTGDGFKVASIFSRWVMCGAQECVQSSPHHEVNLLFPEQWQKGHLFSSINACVVVDFCCVLLILVGLWRKHSLVQVAHLHHSSMSMTWHSFLVCQTQLSYSKIHKNYNRDQIISWIHIFYNEHAVNIWIIIQWSLV